MGFATFRKSFTDRYAQFNKEAPSNEWLEWFVGFYEGDGCFVINHRGD
jgi:hypothetical protein